MALGKRCRHPRKQWSRCGCAYYWNGYQDGHRRWINVGTDRHDARVRAAQLEAQRQAGRLRDAALDKRLSEVADRWLVHVALLGRRPQTIRAYRTGANAVIAYFGAGTSVARIGAGAVAEFEEAAWASRRGAGPRVLCNALQAILGHAHREGLLEAVPVPHRERRVVRDQPRNRMSEAEIEATIAQLPDDLAAMAELVVLTGLRVGECLALRAEDVDLERGIVYVRHSAEQRGRTDAPTKTARSTRALRLDQGAAAILADIAGGAGRLWPITYDAARRGLVSAMQRAGVYAKGRGWHSLRHLNAALRNRAGQSMRDAAAELGHGANFAMTLSYGWPDETAEAVRVSAVRHRRSST